MSEDFQVRVLTHGDTGTLAWEGTTDQKTLDRAISLAADDSLIGQGLRRVEASVSADDSMAMRALHRAGFRREGRRRQVIPDGQGGFVDAVLYSRLIDDQVYGPGGFTAVMDTVLSTHRVIGHVLIRDELGRVLFVETTYKQDWELPGGVIEPREPPRIGAERELQEELGVTITLNQPLVVDWMPPYLGWGDAVEFIFDGGQVDSSIQGAFTKPATEIREYHWVSPDEIPDHVTPLSARRILGILSGLTGIYTENGGPIITS